MKPGVRAGLVLNQVSVPTFGGIILLLLVVISREAISERVQITCCSGCNLLNQAFDESQ